MTTVKVRSDEAAIRALMNNFPEAFNAGNIDVTMKNYISDKSLVVLTLCRERNISAPRRIVKIGKTCSRNSKTRRKSQ